MFTTRKEEEMPGDNSKNPGCLLLILFVLAIAVIAALNIASLR